jgi:hypothetical protein
LCILESRLAMSVLRKQHITAQDEVSLEGYWYSVS